MISCETFCFNNLHEIELDMKIFQSNGRQKDLHLFDVNEHNSGLKFRWNRTNSISKKGIVSELLFRHGSLNTHYHVNFSNWCEYKRHISKLAPALIHYYVCIGRALLLRNSYLLFRSQRMCWTNFPFRAMQRSNSSYALIS